MTTDGDVPNERPGRRRRPFRLDAGPHRVERDVDAELEFHLAMRARRLVDAGLDPAAARERALVQFGDLGAVRAEVLTIDRERERAMRRTIRLEDLRHDAAYALRTLRTRPGYTAVLLLILALGIGANTATFTLVDALLLRPLPVPRPEQLVLVGDPTRPGAVSGGTPSTLHFSYPLYLDVRDGSRTLSGLYAAGGAGSLDVLVREPGRGGGTAAAEPEHPRGRLVSANFFDVLGVRPALGRGFTAEEDRAPGVGPVVVISHAWWTRRFGADPSVVGRTLTVNGTPLTVVGVGPAGFTGDVVGQPTDLWIPLMMQPALTPGQPLLAERMMSWLLFMGRMKPGVTLTEARAELTALAERSLRANPPPGGAGAIDRQLHASPIRVEPGATGFSFYRRVYGPALVTLSVAVGLVLLVVCANVATLLLAHATARGREMSVRMAIGARRSRLVQQLGIESLVLALAGGALGLLVAYWGSTALLRLAVPGPGALPLAARLDGRALAYTGGVVALTALLFGLAPALHATRVELASALRAQGRGLAGAARGAGRVPLGRLLVVAQVALSTLLLVSTGLLVRSARRLERADIGVARGRLVVAGVDAVRAGYEGARLRALMQELLTRVGRVPGAAGATLSTSGLFSGTANGTALQVEGFRATAEEDTLVALDLVGPDYFRTIGARLLRGRDIVAADGAGAPRVAAVNETMARFYFPGGDALGRHVTVDGATYEVVAVVADVKNLGIREAPVRRLYLPALQVETPIPAGRFYLEVRTERDPAALVEPVRRVIRAADPALALSGVNTLDALVRGTTSQDRLTARVVTCFGALALGLASLGLYGVMAYATLRRTGEFGLRLALGARAGDVSRLVLREAIALTAAGVALGVPAAAAGTRLLRSQLFGVGPADAPSFAVAVAVLVASAALAAYLPALRASRASPLESLRAE